MAEDHPNIYVVKRAVGGMKTRELTLYSNNGFLITDSNPDTLIVLMGTNDFGMNIPTEEYKNDLYELIDTLKRLYPKSRIVFLTPLYRDYFGERGFILPGMVNENGNSLYEYIDIIKNEASERGINVIELDEKNYFNKDNLEKYTVDGLHPNKKGNEFLAEKLYKALRDLK